MTASLAQLCRCGHGLSRHRDDLCVTDCSCTEYVPREAPAAPADADLLVWDEINADQLKPLTERRWFSSVNICSLAGISYRQLDYWTRTGYLRPISGGVTPGSGTTRWFAAVELDITVTAFSLINVGFNPQAALTYARQLIETGEPVKVGCVLIGGPA